MATPFSYTVPNWKEGSPYAAETQIMSGLAQQDPGMALPLLGILRSQRESNQLDYAGELDQQHAFAQQQAANHQANEQRTALLTLLERGEKNAGIPGLAMHNPLLYPLLAGTDPGRLDEYTQQVLQHTDAQDLERLGMAQKSSREGGKDIPAGDLSRLSGTARASFSDVLPTAVQAQYARGLIDADKVHVQHVGENAPGYGGAPPTISRTVPSAMAPAALQDIRELGMKPPRTPLAPAPVSPVPPPAPSGAPDPKVAPTTVPTATTPTNSPLTSASRNGHIPGAITLARGDEPGIKDVIRIAGMAMSSLLNKDPVGYKAVADLMQKRGVVPVANIPGAGWMLIGENGEKFPIPGVTGAQGVLR